MTLQLGVTNYVNFAYGASLTLAATAQHAPRYRCPGGVASHRASGLAAVRDMEGTAVAICDSEDSATASLADFVLPVPGDGNESLSPFTYCVPLEMFAYHYAVHKGKTMLRFDDSRRMEVNFRQIFGSQVVATQ